MVWDVLGWFGVFPHTSAWETQAWASAGGKRKELSSIGQQPLTRHRGNHRVLADRKKPVGKYRVPQSTSTSIGHPKVPAQEPGAPKLLHKYQVPQSSSTAIGCPKTSPQPPGAPKPFHSPLKTPCRAGHTQVYVAPTTGLAHSGNFFFFPTRRVAISHHPRYFSKKCV